MGSDLETRIRNVTAVLGPTNTGKTHLAIERMLGHNSGMIGLPLRLLAREVYDKIAARIGADKVALVTGEEKIKPDRARYWVSTVEAMPRDIEVDFLAIDEIQLAGDPERGHVFTDRLLHARGRQETLLLGAQTMSGAIGDLVPGANFISRPRLSKLTYAGEKKITRLPQRTAVIAFSASEVYQIAELIRRQRGGTAVVLGALSPRTRNAQVALYQSGDVDFLVATDAIGMGLNLDVDHVAFSGIRKFDGQNYRNLTPSELAQIAGRAGRHMNDGTFGVTGACEPLDADIIERIETHTFDPVRTLQWRNRDLDFHSLDSLRESLRTLPREQRLTRARMADDVIALETVADDREIRDVASSPAAVLRLWEVCQIPDYRKISSQSHAELVATLYKDLMGPSGRIDADWFARQVAMADRTDGDIDTLATRLAHIRTWTFVSNRADWLADPAHWQGRTRAIEDSLSDALHECLTQRFVDRRTSALMKGMRDKEELSAEITEDGAVNVEAHFVGRLRGFRFDADTSTDGIHGRAARSAAAQVLANELAMRVRRVAAAQNDAFKLDRRGYIVWRGEEIARLEAAENPLAPSVILLADDMLSPSEREKIQSRLDTWLTHLINEKLQPLVALSRAEDVHGLARGIAFRLMENFGALKRESVAEEMKSLDQPARAQLRKYGVRFGAFNVFFPALLKPAPAELTRLLWLLRNAQSAGLDRNAPPEPPRAGLTSAVCDPAVPEGFYRAAGYHTCGPRVIRFDMIERLADLIRPLLAWRPGREGSEKQPTGSTGDGGFTVTPEMMSILGCSPEDLGKVLKALGFWVERRPVTSARSIGTPAAGFAKSADGPVDTPAPAGDTASVPTADLPENREAEVAIEAMTGATRAQADSTHGNPGTADRETFGADSHPPRPAEPADSGSDEPIVMEEVWRPRRHQRPERRRNDKTAGLQEHRARRPHHRHRHKGSRPAGEASPAQAALPTDGLSATTNVADRPQGDDRRPANEDIPRRQDSPSGGGSGRGGVDRRERHPSAHRDTQKQKARRGADPGRFERPRSTEAAPPRKSSREADSPFAALLALRAQLEQTKRDKSST